MNMVANSEAVTSYFGYWPEFADGTVLRFLFEAPGTISLSVRYGDATTGRSGEVDLLFERVTLAELSELREQNVIDVLVLVDGSPMEVRLDGAYGLHGSFACESAAVVDFRRIVP
jgi:hypothetical protein